MIKMPHGSRGTKGNVDAQTRRQSAKRRAATLRRKLRSAEGQELIQDILLENQYLRGATGLLQAKPLVLNDSYNDNYSSAFKGLKPAANPQCETND